MPAQYLDEYVRELKREGESALRSRYLTPVLIVTSAGGEMRDKAKATEATVTASSSGWRLQELSLLNRVFQVAKGTFAPPGPVTLEGMNARLSTLAPEAVAVLVGGGWKPSPPKGP